jgi:heat shock protein HslJ
VGSRALLPGALLLAAGCTTVAAEPRTLAGTHWQVVAINGQATPPGPFEMTFEAGSFAAQMGCNRAGGDYRIAGGTLNPGAVAATEMACDHATDVPATPLMTWEQSGFAVLSRPMTMRWNSGDRLTLSNAAGSIALELRP